jgi:hypothetical protein
MPFISRLPVLLCLALLPGLAPAAPCRIRPDGIGPARPGMTLLQVKHALPGSRFTRQADGDGAVSVLVTLRGDDAALLELYASDVEETGPMPWRKTVAAVASSHPRCRTADGVRPGMRVADAERVFGRVTEIVRSELEAREFATFRRQPAGYLIQLDWGGGVFGPHARRTAAYARTARILSISIR